MADFNSWGNKFIKVSVNMASGVAYVFRDFAVKIDVDKKSGEPIIVKVSEKELSKSCQAESKTQTPEKRKKSKGKHCQ